MKKILPLWMRSLLCSGILLLMGTGAYASHIVGADLSYKWIGTSPTDYTYRVTVVLYGNCGLSSASSFGTLPVSVPTVCIYDGATLSTSINCNIVDSVSNKEVTPVCPADSLSTQCHVTSSLIPGIKQFVYVGTVTLSHTSAYWRFVYEGYNGGAGAAAGRAAAITNLIGTTTIQLIDTLNNSATNTRGHNSSPELTVLPVPFFCDSTLQCYNPGAVDVFDTNYINEPSGDSLYFSLIAATSGSGAGTCTPPGGPVGYVLPTTASNPLLLTSGTLFFDHLSGEMCFQPADLQRAVVVYNIEEYRNDTVLGVVHKVLVGSMQREMTFTVIDCHNTSPVSYLDTVAGGTKVDSFHLYVCQNTDTAYLHVDPREPDTTLHIIVTATGLSPGFVFSVAGNNTDTPNAVIAVNTFAINPGIYTFYINATDDHCPLTGSKTTAFTVQIYPVPTIRDSLISPATCDKKAAYMLIPGGTGKPWTFKISHQIALDTFQTFVDSVAFIDSLAPSPDQVTIYTAVTDICGQGTPLIVDSVNFRINGTYVSPDYCGGQDGYIIIDSGLHTGKLDSAVFTRFGVQQLSEAFYVNSNGRDTLPGLIAGNYQVWVTEGYCITNILLDTLVNPPFTMGTVTFSNPTKCGFCTGVDTVWGLHPSQLDTITYAFTPLAGGATTTTSVSHFITADSFVILSGLCEGTYSNFVVNTAGKSACADSCCVVLLVSPPLTDSFRLALDYGCNGDTVSLTNRSAPAADLFYHWDFGDGTTSSDVSPTHIYTMTNNNTVTVSLDITNSKCVDTFAQTVYMNNYVHAAFTMDPPKFMCQLDSATFTNLSIGASPITNDPPTYTWIFGDGTTNNIYSPVHTFTNTNAYTIKLVAANTVPCYDTATATLQVDSISVISLQVTDSVICRGQSITFTGIYTSIGDTGNTWSFGDENGIVDINPVMHSYDDTGMHTVSITALYRACPQESTTQNVYVIPQPSLYLGPDMAICPGGNPITLIDDRNQGLPDTKWLWSTGDTSAGITVNQPGYYSVMVTRNGCSAYDTVWVQKDCYMDIPNVFTPNGDGTNDYFYPRQLLTKGLIKFKMDIYNRWGQLIYETTSTDGRGWDGAFNGVQQPTGVYVYLIEATFKDGQIENHQGNVTLLR